MNSRKVSTLAIAFACVTPLFPISAVYAQSPSSENESSQAEEISAAQSKSDEIIVTARKRAESLTEVPVAITAVTGAQLEQRGINSIDGLARLVPQLVVGEGGGTIQGGIISLRGIAGAEGNPFGDQAVSFNIDGVQIARSTVRRMSEMDIAQVEVLKGPQALFFGKNSPGGVISIRSADPTSSFAAKVSGGYEFNAHEWRGDGFVSSPLTDTLGVRIAAYGSTMKGWTTTQVPTSSPLQPDNNRAPNASEYAVRGTLKFDPSSEFDARLKLTYNSLSGDSSTANSQFVNCPLGTPQTGGVDDCTANSTVSWANANVIPAGFDSRFTPNHTFLAQNQLLAGLEMNYHPSDTVTLTSVSGYYRAKIDSIGIFTGSYTPTLFIQGLNNLKIREVSQELRLNTDFSGAINFTAGGYFQDSRVDVEAHSFRNVTAPVENTEYYLVQKGTAYSVFGQARLKFLSTMELTAGGRYSHEKKTLPVLEYDALAAANPARLTAPRTPQTPIVAQRMFNNFSPEITLSWRPNRDLNVYGSYKEGFLSGGFNSGAANFASNLTYEQQIVKGFEGGIKAELLDGALRTTLAFYRYTITGLQVNTNIGTVVELRNAGKVRTTGAEFEFSYRTPIDGLSFNGAIAYDKARYVDYQAPCYRGQNLNSVVPCLVQLNRVTNLVALQQDLSGTELLRTPKWAGNFAVDFVSPVTDRLKFGLAGDVTFSSSQLTDALSKAHGRSPSYAMVGATVRLMDEQAGWEVAFIGRNLTKDYYWVRSADNPFSGTAPTATTAAGVLGDTIGPVNRSRELMLRLTYKFGG